MGGEIEAILKELLHWFKVTYRPQVAERLAKFLPNEIDRRIYDLSDGYRSLRDISARVGVSAEAIRLRWQAWARAGIMEPSPHYRGRYVKIIDLSEVGLSVEERAEEIGEKEEGNNDGRGYSRDSQ